jgi:hypothetical protein
MLFVLRQAVGDREPGRLGADEDVSVRPDARIVDQRAHGDVNEGPVTDHRIKDRAADCAVGVVSVLVAVGKKTILSLDDGQFRALDAGERLEGRAGRSPAVRTSGSKQRSGKRPLR